MWETSPNRGFINYSAANAGVKRPLKRVGHRAFQPIVGDTANEWRGLNFSSGLFITTKDLAYKIQITTPTTKSLEYQVENLSYWLQAATVNITGAPAISNYQYRVIVKWRPGMQTDFGDIRFTDNSGNKLYCFRIKMEEGYQATYYVKVPTASVTSIRMLFQGPAGSTVQQNGIGTFDFFDDFLGTSLDTSKWAWAWLDTINVADSKLTLTQTNSSNWGYLRALNATYGEGYSCDWLLTAYEAGGSYYKHNCGWYDSLDYYETYYAYMRIPGKLGGTYGCADVTLGENCRTVGQINSVGRYGSAAYYYCGSDSPLISATTAYTGNLHPGYLVRINTAQSIHGMDWIFVRKFVYPEPVTTVDVPSSIQASLEYQITGQANAKGIQKTLEYCIGSVGDASTTLSVYTTLPYNYRKTVTITTPTDVGGYQHKVPVTYVAGMKTDFSDLFFTEINGTKCPYWIETPTMGTAATAWVKVPHGGQRKLYMYYGRPAQQGSNSNGKETFELFDDFVNPGLDKELWAGPDWYAATSVAFSKNPATPNTICTLKTYDIKNNSIYARIKVTNPPATYARMLLGWASAANMTGIRYFIQNAGTYRVHSMNAAGTQSGTAVGSWPADTFIVVDMHKSADGATNISYFDHGSVMYTNQVYNDTGTLQYIGASHYNETSKITWDWVLLKKWVAATPSCSVGSAVTMMRRPGPRYVGVSSGAPITTAIEKTLQYRVWGHVSVQKSLTYQISPVVQQVLTYRVNKSSSIQHYLQYFLQSGSSFDITHDLKYCVSYTYTAPTLALQYVMLTRRSLPLEYRVGSTTKITKTLWYFISTGTIYTWTMYQSLGYKVVAPKPISISLKYQISPVIRPVLQYRIYGVHSITKSLWYALGTNIKVSSTYKVRSPVYPPVKKYLTYHIFGPLTIAAAPTSGMWPLNVQCTASSSCPGITWNWDFGDGAGAGERNPIHQYTRAATCYIACTASHASTATTFAGTPIKITTQNYDVVIYFTVDKRTGGFPLRVKFNNLSNVPPGTVWDWDFGDGSAHSTDHSPSHVYATIGTFDVTLTATW